MKARGKTPQALLDKPSAPWYYRDFIRHYTVLSNSRTYRSEIRVKDSTPYFLTAPNPIDITSILRYNKDVVKMENCEDFICIIQTLDQLFLNHREKKSRS